MGADALPHLIGFVVADVISTRVQQQKRSIPPSATKPMASQASLTRRFAMQCLEWARHVIPVIAKCAIAELPHVQLQPVIGYIRRKIICGLAQLRDRCMPFE